MKNLLIFLFFTSFLFAQNDTIKVPEQRLSVIGLDRVNVVYRGIPNPISVLVPNTKNFSVVANGLENKGNGKFVLKPGVGKSIDIFVYFKNNKGKLISEKHTFRIKNLPQPIGLLNGENCSNCLVLLKKEDIEKSIISTKMEDFLFFDLDSDFFKVNSFEVKFNENKIIRVEGNTFNNEVIAELKKLSKNYIFEIIKIDSGPDCLECTKRRAFPIKVILED